MTVSDWKFTTREGLVLDEHTDYPVDIKDMAREMEMPDNTLSYAKVSIYHEDLHDVVFHILDCEVALPTDKIITFNPFVRGICDGMSGSEGSGDLFYILDGEEHPLKKNYLSHQSQDLTILRRLQGQNTD